MPAHRILHEFVASGVDNAGTAGSSAGWTETWYDPANISDEQAQLNAESYMSERLKLLTNGWGIQALRVSQLDAFNNLVRKGRLVQYNPKVMHGTYGNIVGHDAIFVDEQPWDAINISIGTVGGSRRAFLMRGIDGSVIAPSGRNNNPATWAQYFSRYVRNLTSTGGAGGMPYALRTRSAVAEVEINNVLLTAVANVNAVIDPVHPAIRVPLPGIAAGRQVSIKGVLGMQNINANWTVAFSIVDPTNPNFLYAIMKPRRRVIVDGTYEHGGTARSWAWVLDNVQTASAGGGASRRTGRPPQQLRGRRSSRR